MPLLRNARRVAPPKISPRIAKLDMEIAGIDVVYPFGGSQHYVSHMGVIYPAIVCVLTRFCVCSIPPQDLTSGRSRRSSRMVGFVLLGNRVA